MRSVFAFKFIRLLFGAVAALLVMSGDLAFGGNASIRCSSIFLAETKPRPVGWLGRVIGFFGSNASTRYPKTTAVKLSGAQERQESSIRDDLQRVQEVVNEINARLLSGLSSPVPASLYVHFFEQEQSHSASISSYEMNLTSNQVYKDREIRPIIAHEYFHLILNLMIAKKSPIFASRMEMSLQDIKAQRKAHKIRIENKERESLLLQKKNLARDLDFAEFALQAFRSNSMLGPAAFTSRDINELLKPSLAAIHREDIFGALKISAQTAPEIIHLLDAFIDSTREQLMDMPSEKDLAPLSLPNSLLSVQDKTTLPHIESFYSNSLSEVFADLGAVLLTRKADVLSNELDSLQRDFDRKIGFEDHVREFYERKVYGSHSFFSYLRNVLWQKYFSQVAEDKWPKMIDVLGTAFAGEIANNPPHVFLTFEGTSLVYVDYELANKHLETVVEGVLMPLIRQ